MAIALYDLSVPTYLQTLGSVAGFMEKGLAYCRENNVDPDLALESFVLEPVAGDQDAFHPRGSSE